MCIVYSALALAIETMAANDKSKEFKREIWLFTDGEYAADWGGGSTLEGAMDRYTQLKVSLHVVSVLSFVTRDPR